MAFKIGDRVKVIESGLPWFQMVGTVKSVEVRDDYNIHAVELDDYSDGHECGGKCKYSSGRWHRDSYLRLIIEEFIKDPLFSLEEITEWSLG